MGGMKSLAYCVSVGCAYTSGQKAKAGGCFCCWMCTRSVIFCSCSSTSSKSTVGKFWQGRFFNDIDQSMNSYATYSIFLDIPLGRHWRRESTTTKGIILVVHCTGGHRQRRGGFSSTAQPNTLMASLFEDSDGALS